MVVIRSTAIVGRCLGVTFLSKLNLFANVDWSQLGTTILTRIIQLVLVSLLFYLINLIGQRLINKGMDHYASLEQTSTTRSYTLKSLLKNILRYTLLLFYVYSVLNLFGIPVGTLVASAGIASLAIGLGAQGFVNDIVTGFFILFEQQLEVEDYVQIGDITGTVSAVGLRTTQIRSFDGTLHYIPNRNISVISNFSRGHRQQIMNLRLDPQTDIKKLETILAPINKQVCQETDELLSEPQLLGANLLANGDLVYQIQISPQQGMEIPMQRLLLGHYLPALQAAGITLPQSLINLK